MKRSWIAITAAVGLLAVGGGVLASRGGKEKPKKGEPETPFRLGKVRAEDLQVSVREVGVVDPETKVDVKSVVSGKVVTLKVREGALVKKGDVLAEVEPDVTQAQSLSDVKASVTDAELRLKDAERELKSQTALFSAGLVGADTLKNVQNKRDIAAEGLKAAETRYRIVENHGIPISGDAESAQRARVTSPMDGVVITRGVELGDTITSGVSSFNAGTVLFTVADLKTLLVKVNLNEVDIAKVAVGQPVRITLDAYPQRSFTGKVRFVAPAAKLVEKIKVFPVEIALDALSDAFRTGMSANVEILGEKRGKALSVPLEALQRSEGNVVVYRLKKVDAKAIQTAKQGLTGRTKYLWLSEHWKEYFEPVAVSAGVATLERAEILTGVKENDQVCLEDPTKKKVEKDDEGD